MPNQPEIYRNVPDELDQVSETSSSFDYKPSRKVTQKQLTVGIVAVAVVLTSIIAFTIWRVVFSQTAVVGPKRSDTGVYFSAGSDKGMSESTIGLSPGGAYNLNQFRKLISDKYLPLPTDIAVEGLFSEYFFNTGETEECHTLFCPSYSYAVTRDPFSQVPEYYLSVGFNSGVKEETVTRPKLDLVVALDISGSMGESISQTNEDKEPTSTDEQKIKVARESLVELLKKLQADDRFGLVLFDDQSFVEVPISKVSEMSIEEIEKQILNIKERGNTNIESGLEKSIGLLESVPIEAGYDKRVVLITDAQPNVGDVSNTGLSYLVEDAAERQIYTTIIGVGLDLNSELTSFLGQQKGANYFSVNSVEQFKNQLSTEFDYMVTPLVFDLDLQLQSKDFEVERVYGVANSDQANNTLIRIPSLFASQQKQEQTKGGLILVKLRRKQVSDGSITLTAHFKDRENQPGAAEIAAVITDSEPDYYDTSGIRKGVLLARYAELLQQWSADEQLQGKTGIFEGSLESPSVVRKDGIGIYQQNTVEWDLSMKPLRVSEPYKTLFGEFKQYFQLEAKELDDQTLQQELIILEELD